jgi:putative ABC transport system permease protein
MYSVVLNEEVARKFFGKSSAMGKLIELPTGEDGAFQNLKLLVLCQNHRKILPIKIQMLLPMKLNLREGRADNQWLNFFLNTFVVLQPGADIKKVEAEFAKVYEAKAADQIKEGREKYQMTENFSIRFATNAGYAPEYRLFSGEWIGR